ncbi:MAG: ATP-dependent DNA helicase PcrA, partial [Candidatus Marinimicrobia bacterium]|nr:ATP-dependent DNA helicase PcrA [Candidatus Neomarinimicrobiota bacterium]
MGDDAQAIYSWRNANFQNILDFERDWPEAKIIKLEQNYRSTKNIVAAASELVAHNQLGYPKKLWTKNPEGDLIAVRELSNEYEEGEFILGEIEHQ